VAKESVVPTFSKGLVFPVGALLAATTGCGYHVAGKADTVPKSVQTVAVLPFVNLSSRYKFTDKVQEAISREMIAKTRFQVVRDKEHADALLEGAINNVLTFPVIFDPATFKTTVVQVLVIIQLSLKERTSGKVLYNRPPFVISNNYQISLYANQYFDESSLALDRIAADLARSIVMGINENF
jgi:hypothetical protein